MTVVEIATPYQDTAAAGLRFSTATGRLPAVAAATIDGLEVRILGASHQVVHPGGIETVACLPSDGEPLPRAAWNEHHGRFSSTVTTLDPDRFAVVAAHQIRPLQDDPRAVVAHFPGHPDAVTAVRVDGDAAGWETWHLYPQHGEIVHTRTRLFTQEEPCAKR